MNKTWTWASIVVLLLAVDGVAQDKPEAPKRKPIVRLKVQIVLTKQQDDRKVASMPYALVCNADDGRPGPGIMGTGPTVSAVRMGIEVPIPEVKDGATNVQYRNVGIKLDCQAWALDDGRYRLELGVEQSSIQPNRQQPKEDAEGRKLMPEKMVSGNDMPLFRSFKASFVPILKDGQTAQYTTATDPVSGEVVKIDVTVNVVK